MLVAYFNSDLVKYFLFLFSSSWGIERERILLTELLEVPDIIQLPIEQEDILEISLCYDKIVNEQKKALINETLIKNIEYRIYTLLCKYFCLSNKDQILIADLLKYQLSLLYKGSKSIAFNRTILQENSSYASMLCNELNVFLETATNKANATIFDVQVNDPLNMVVVHFDKIIQNIKIQDVNIFRDSLRTIDSYMVQEKAKSIYVRKDIKFYNDNAVYIIRPNQKRFWTQSQAIEDATSLIADILNMK